MNCTVRRHNFAVLRNSANSPATHIFTLMKNYQIIMPLKYLYNPEWHNTNGIFDFSHYWSFEFFLNVFHWIQRIQWQKIYDIRRTRTSHTATSCVRDQDATTAPARHMWETGSLNWAQFMLQWFIRFPEFTEFSESSAPFSKNSIDCYLI